MNAKLVLATLIGLVACSSDKTHPGAVAIATGGTEAMLGTGGDVDSGLVATGGTSSTQGGTSGVRGGSDAGESGGDTNSPGGTSGTDFGGSAAQGGSTSGVGGTDSQGGSTSGVGGTDSQGGTVSSSGGRAVTGGAPSPGLDSRCSPKAKAGTSVAVSGLALNTTSQFVAVTPDELTIAWTEPATGGVTIAVADRDVASAVWSTPQTITNVPAVDGRVAISHDGLTLAYVDGGNPRTFATVSRVDRVSAFVFDALASGADFAVQNGSSLLSSGDTYAYPLFGPQSTTFYYAIKSATGALEWYQAGRFEPFGLFSEGAPIRFADAPATTLLLSGVASDQNTLFFTDPSTAETTWSFYDDSTTQFGALAVLGVLGFAQPNVACTRLYGSVSTGTLATTILQ